MESNTALHRRLWCLHPPQNPNRSGRYGRWGV